MTKTVTIKSGRTFRTLTEAKRHYGAIREDAAIGSKLSEPVRSDVIDVYERYCRATKWQAENAIDVVVDWDNRKRSHEGYAQTKAFYIVSLSGENHVFSIDKALSAIAI